MINSTLFPHPLTLSANLDPIVPKTPYQNLLAYKYDENCNLYEASQAFLSTYKNSETQRVYTAAFRQLFLKNFLDASMKLKDFANQNRNNILDNIRANLTTDKGKRMY